MRLCLFDILRCIAMSAALSAREISLRFTSPNSFYTTSIPSIPSSSSCSRCEAKKTKEKKRDFRQFRIHPFLMVRNLEKQCQGRWAQLCRSPKKSSNESLPLAMCLNVMIAQKEKKLYEKFVKQTQAQVRGSKRLFLSGEKVNGLDICVHKHMIDGERSRASRRSKETVRTKRSCIKWMNEN